MLSVDKYTTVLDYVKQAVVMTSFLEKTLLKTEKVTTSDEVHKYTENITTIEEVLKGTYEVYKCIENITTNEDVDKGTEKLEDMK